MATKAKIINNGISIIKINISPILPLASYPLTETYTPSKSIQIEICIKKAKTTNFDFFSCLLENLCYNVYSVEE